MFKAVSSGLAGYTVSLMLVGNRYIVPAYAVLTLYSVPRVATYRWGSLRVTPLVEAILLGVSVHLFTLPSSTLFHGLTAASYAAALLTALIEEMFFRHTLQGIGVPLSSLLFSLYHLSFKSPAYLAVSALFVPTFFMLGCLFYEIYERRGLLYAVVAHGAFNVVAISYLVDATPIYALVYALSASIVYLVYRVYA